MSRDSGRPRHVFQSFWLGDSLSPLEHLCIKSFVAHGHEFVLYAYDDVANVPPGCRVEDASAILGAEHIFLSRMGWFKGGASPFADRFRYELLRARGGWWVDTDVLCLRHEIPEVPYVFAKQGGAHQDLYNNAILRVPADSAFLSEAIERCERADIEDIDVDTLAPLLVDDLVRQLDLEAHAWPREQLYPLDPGEVLAYLDPAQADRIEALVESSMFVHLWTNMFRLANVLKDIRPPEGSYLDRMYKAYEIEFPYSRRYDWSEIEPQAVFEQECWALYDKIGHLSAELGNERTLRASGEHGLAIARAQLERGEFELATTRAQLERYEQSVTIQLFCRLRDRVYGTIGRGSLLGRAIQGSLRLIGRLLVRGGDDPERHDTTPVRGGGDPERHDTAPKPETSDAAEPATSADGWHRAADIA